MKSSLPSQHLFGATKEDHEKITQDNPFLGRDLNPEQHEPEADIIATTPQQISI
jgi:hypothetical protein